MTMTAALTPQGQRVPLAGYAVFGGLLSAAGLPLYIHAPKFYVDEYGVSLGLLGAVLFGLRLLDVVQDPLLGRLASKTTRYRALSVAIGVVALCAGILGLFAITPLTGPVLWFAMMLTVVFSAFSFLTICFYAQGVSAASRMTKGGHLRIARWRETGALAGVCVAAIAPVALRAWTDAPLAGFAIGFATLGVIALGSMRTAWDMSGVPAGQGFSVVLKDRLARRLLLIALINAAPVAVSSTLFLFFVESRLGAPGSEGILLLLFFLSAALSVPLWGSLAERMGTKRVLLSAMLLAVGGFGFALGLGTGDTVAFGVICVLSGAAMGADLTLLPAAFASRMAKISPGAAEGFGLWAFVSKLSLAFAAIALLPLLEQGGFIPGTTNTDAALWRLSLLYAAVPCGLKLLAITVLITTQLEES